MKFIDSFLIALTGLKSNKGRSALTILGVVIGVSAIIGVMAIGQGAQGLILAQISSMGSNNIFIEPGPWSQQMESGSMMQSMMEEFDIKTLKHGDALAIAKLPSIDMAASLVMGVDRLIYGNESKKVTFLGISSDMPKINETEVAMGRNISEQDVKSMARVAVLGYEIRLLLLAGKKSLSHSGVLAF